MVEVRGHRKQSGQFTEEDRTRRPGLGWLLGLFHSSRVCDSNQWGLLTGLPHGRSSPRATARGVSFQVLNSQALSAALLPASSGFWPCDPLIYGWLRTTNSIKSKVQEKGRNKSWTNPSSNMKDAYRTKQQDWLYLTTSYIRYSCLTTFACSALFSSPSRSVSWDLTGLPLGKGFHLGPGFRPSGTLDPLSSPWLKITSTFSEDCQCQPKLSVCLWLEIRMPSGPALVCV